MYGRGRSWFPPVHRLGLVVVAVSMLLPLSVLSQAQTASAATPGVVTFVYTGAAQSWQVPKGIKSIRVDAFGAQGGGAYGGLGAEVSAVLPVVPGEELTVTVGGAGALEPDDTAGGFNGGGAVSTWGGYTGGGASDVRDGVLGLADRIIVAGGGGGGAGGPIAGMGGAGAYPAGEPATGGGGGGTQTNGGASPEGLPAGVFGAGGPAQAHAGAGGGGYYGGGGGLDSLTYSGPSGGGGGSSYAAPTATNVTSLTGAQLGNGQVTITYPAKQPTGKTPAGVATFTNTGAPQFWQVPPGIRSLRIDARGARGGGPYGGFGGDVAATFAVTPGQMFEVTVGGAGGGPFSDVTAGGFNGGGLVYSYGGYTGGGGTDVRTNGFQQDDRILVAGGGGGGAGGPVFGMGGSAGLLTGEPGDPGDQGRPGGGGATQTAGGVGENGLGASSGGTGFGGDAEAGAGGGGGGYYGGGGGNGDVFGGSAGGGGAGGGHIDPTATDVASLDGVQLGDGQVTITYPARKPASKRGVPGIAPFYPTESPQYWPVPSGITSVKITADGAEGGGAFPGGVGGETVATLHVTPGQLLVLFPGVSGYGDGFNGGGAQDPNSETGGGGGASDVRVDGTVLGDRVVVAGGGGAGGTPDLLGGGGGLGGGIIGLPGGFGVPVPPTPEDPFPIPCAGGLGGSQSASLSGSDSPMGESGVNAGGGGYFGGGAGFETGYLGCQGAPGGGGGGSGYAAPGTTHPSLIGFSRHGLDGYIMLAYK